MKFLVPRSDVPSISRLQDRMNRLFSNFMDGDEDWSLPAEGFVPAIDVTDKAERLVVKVEVPGIPAEDIEVSVQNDVLTISGERKSEKEEKGEHSVRREFSYGRFARSLSLPCPVESDKVEATCDNGVLMITLPKAQAAKSKPIPIKRKK